MSKDAIILDTETFYQKTSYSVAQMGNYGYTHDARFDCYMLSVCDGSQSWAGHPRDFNWNSIQGRVLVSHNAAFDRHVVARLEELGKAPPLDFEAWHCSANLTSFLCDRRALDKASKFLMGLDVAKGMRDWMSGHSWQDAVKEGKAEELTNYARHDAELAWQLWDKFSPQWPEQERLLSELTIEGEFYGIRIDQLLLAQYIQIAEQAMISNESRLPWMPEGKAPTSPLAIAAECRKVGIPCPPIKADDDEGFQAWEDAWAPAYSWVQAVASWRVINKFLATLKTFKERLRPDGTVPVPLKYFGAHSGRWSGASGLNFLNFRKEPIFLDAKFQIIEQHGLLKAIHDSVELCGQLPDWCPHALDVRKVLIPREGHKFILPDYSQIEPRVLAWLSKDWDFLDQVSTGMSPYEAHARATMGWTGGELKKENPKLYNLAKIRVLQLGYQSGWKKLRDTAWKKLQLELSEEESRKIVQDFRDQNPKITRVWELMQRSLKMAVAQHEDMFALELPTGRCLHYGKPARGVRVTMNEDTSQLEKRVVMTTDVGGIRKQTYGGLLTENWVQATAREVFAEGLLALRRAGHRALFHVYDDMCLEVKPEVTCAEVERIMAVTPAWLPRCPIAAEAHENFCYDKR